MSTQTVKIQRISVSECIRNLVYVVLGTIPAIITH